MLLGLNLNKTKWLKKKKRSLCFQVHCGTVRTAWNFTWYPRRKHRENREYKNKLSLSPVKLSALMQTYFQNSLALRMLWFPRAPGIHTVHVYTCRPDTNTYIQNKNLKRRTKPFWEQSSNSDLCAVSVEPKVKKARQNLCPGGSQPVQIPTLVLVRFLLL